MKKTLIFTRDTHHENYMGTNEAGFFWWQSQLIPWVLSRRLSWYNII